MAYIFLSYSSSEDSIAGRVRQALVDSGHRVFFSRLECPDGEEYRQTLRTEIARCDLFMCLLSPRYLVKSNYAWFEFELAQDRWDSPLGHVLPIVVKPIDEVPEYIDGVSVKCEPRAAAAQAEWLVYRATASRVWLLLKHAYRRRTSAVLLVSLGLLAIPWLLRPATQLAPLWPRDRVELACWGTGAVLLGLLVAVLSARWRRGSSIPVVPLLLLAAVLFSGFRFLDLTSRHIYVNKGDPVLRLADEAAVLQPGFAQAVADLEAAQIQGHETREAAFLLEWSARGWNPENVWKADRVASVRRSMLGWWLLTLWALAALSWTALAHPVRPPATPEPGTPGD